MSRTLSLRLDRRPLQVLDTSNDEAVRDFLLQQVREQLVVFGQVRPRLTLLARRFWEEAGLDDLDATEQVMATLLPALRRDRADIDRCIRVGLVEHDGPHVALLEIIDPGELDWKLWLTPVVSPSTPHPSLGEPGAARTGSGLQSLPAPLHAWLDAGARRAASRTTGTAPPNLTQLDLRMAQLPRPEDLPEGGEPLLAALAHGLELEVLQSPPEAWVFLVGRTEPAIIERWEVRGAATVSLDEIIRVSAQNEPADWVLLLHPAEVNTPERKLPAWVSVLEQAGQVWRRIRPYLSTDNGVQVFEPIVQDQGAAGPASWLEVTPMEGLSLFVKGVPGQGGPAAEA